MLRIISQIAVHAGGCGSRLRQNRAREPIVKEPGMFRDRSGQFAWDGDLSKLTDGQLEKVMQRFEQARQEAVARTRGGGAE